MTEFTLDTSGEVILPYPNLHPHPRGITWPDLSPFEQGYVAKLLEDASERIFDQLCSAAGTAAEYVSYGFSDLAPATLAAIRKDCADYRADASRSPMLRTGHETKGRFFYEMRQQGQSGRAFPPLTVTLGDDGKVYARAAS